MGEQMFSLHDLGNASLSKGTTGLGAIQKPLKELYFSFKKSVAKLPTEVYMQVKPDGLTVLSQEGTTSQLRPVHHEMSAVISVEAVQFATSKAFHKKVHYAFLPLNDKKTVTKDKLFSTLEKKNFILMQQTHQPLVACVLRRQTGPKSLDVHVFIARSVSEAIKITELFEQMHKQYKQNQYVGDFRSNDKSADPSHQPRPSDSRTPYYGDHDLGRQEPPLVGSGDNRGPYSGMNHKAINPGRHQPSSLDTGNDHVHYYGKQERVMDPGRHQLSSLDTGNDHVHYYGKQERVMDPGRHQPSSLDTGSDHAHYYGKQERVMDPGRHLPSSLDTGNDHAHYYGKQERVMDPGRHQPSSLDTGNDHAHYYGKQERVMDPGRHLPSSLDTGNDHADYYGKQERNMDPGRQQPLLDDSTNPHLPYHVEKGAYRERVYSDGLYQLRDDYFRPRMIEHPDWNGRMEERGAPMRNDAYGNNKSLPYNQYQTTEPEPYISHSRGNSADDDNYNRVRNVLGPENNKPYGYQRHEQPSEPNFFKNQKNIQATSADLVEGPSYPSYQNVDTRGVDRTFMPPHNPRLMVLHPEKAHGSNIRLPRIQIDDNQNPMKVANDVHLNDSRPNPNPSQFGNQMDYRSVDRHEVHPAHGSLPYSLSNLESRQGDEISAPSAAHEETNYGKPVAKVPPHKIAGVKVLPSLFEGIQKRPISPKQHLQGIDRNPEQYRENYTRYPNPGGHNTPFLGGKAPQSHSDDYTGITQSEYPKNLDLLANHFGPQYQNRYGSPQFTKDTHDDFSAQKGYRGQRDPAMNRSHEGTRPSNPDKREAEQYDDDFTRKKDEEIASMFRNFDIQPHGRPQYGNPNFEQSLGYFP